jgi:cysteinyl-tRNA synthetase
LTSIREEKTKYLGEQFDIHTGGEDHIPVHHTNEIAQSEAAFGKKPWVRYWLHGAFLTFRGEKVSKSKGGLFTISELEEKGFPSLSYRYFVLTGHYRTQLNFSLENLENAKNAYLRLRNIMNEIKDDGKINEKYLKDFEKAINNDLDMPKALQVLWKLARDEKAQGKYQTIKKMDEVLGLDLLKKEEIDIPEIIRKLAEEREKARENKDWKKADEIRNLLKDKGWQINDTKEGAKLKKI